ncbi:hypothetical protein ACFXAW_30185 [Streptomyces sp. NPDC059445]|uniref:hypothetical protein n=1 Tax=Streptomyces sp. NPDC059445 TaxID=3346832 RepID=UPI0036979514
MNQITGGVFFHAVIQGRDITVQLPPEVNPALSGLPAAWPTFTGRDAKVEALLRYLVPVVDGNQDAAEKSEVTRLMVAELAGVKHGLRWRRSRRRERFALRSSLFAQGFQARLRVGIRPTPT